MIINCCSWKIIIACFVGVVHFGPFRFMCDQFLARKQFWCTVACIVPSKSTRQQEVKTRLHKKSPRHLGCKQQSRLSLSPHVERAKQRQKNIQSEVFLTRKIANSPFCPITSTRFASVQQEIFYAITKCTSHKLAARFPLTGETVRTKTGHCEKIKHTHTYFKKKAESVPGCCRLSRSPVRFLLPDYDIRQPLE